MAESPVTRKRKLAERIADNDAKLRHGDVDQLESDLYTGGIRQLGVGNSISTIIFSPSLRLTVPLTREDVEEDFWAITGNPPPRSSRRARRRLMENSLNMHSRWEKPSHTTPDMGWIPHPTYVLKTAASYPEVTLRGSTGRPLRFSKTHYAKTNDQARSEDQGRLGEIAAALEMALDSTSEAPLQHDEKQSGDSPDAALTAGKTEAAAAGSTLAEFANLGKEEEDENNLLIPKRRRSARIAERGVLPFSGAPALTVMGEPKQQPVLVVSLEASEILADFIRISGRPPPPIHRRSSSHFPPYLPFFSAQEVGSWTNRSAHVLVGRA